MACGIPRLQLPVLSTKTLFILKALGLWILIAALGVVTSVADIASWTPSDCYPPTNSTLSVGNADSKCTDRERISSAVYRHSSYLQSLHIFLLSVIAVFVFIVFEPALWCMVWSALERPRSLHSTSRKPMPPMTLAALENGVKLTNNPSALNSIIYGISIWKESKTPQWSKIRSVPREVWFVFLTTVLALLSPFAVSPIYKSHNGGSLPFSVDFTVGGGVGIGFSRELNASDVVPKGVAVGRAIINSASAMDIPVASITHDINVAPFIPRNIVTQIWSAQVETVVARNQLDCGPSTPTRIANSTNIVTIDQNSYWSGEFTEGIKPSFAGFVLGPFTNDPQVTVVYLNRTNTSAPGWVEVETSIIFLAANGTLEGAQQRISPPQGVLTSESGRRGISFIDVLVCTSTTRLEISSCHIFGGRVTGCIPSQGDVTHYIANAPDVAAILSASPMTGYYRLNDRLPMYGDITGNMVASNVPPFSYLTASTTSLLYRIPLSYVREVLFGQTAQAIVQGLGTTWVAERPHEVSRIATFGTSQPWLTNVVMALSVIGALTATVWGTVARAAGVPIDLARLLAISRNPQLDATFEPYADRNISMENSKVFNMGVSYTYVEGTNRRALMVASLNEESSNFLKDF